MCDYFVGCDRPAVGTLDHPLAGRVDACQRCADLGRFSLLPLHATPGSPSTPTAPPSVAVPHDAHLRSPPA